jgi:DNA-binding NarL/FixJ family response regulator
MSENAEPVTVVVADDQSAVREGLVLLLGTVPGIAVIGEAEDGEAAVEAVAAKDPQVVLMDLNMPRCDGVEATRRVRASHPRTQVVVLTTYSDDESIIGALRAGALGYLTKDATRAEIGRAVLAAAAGQAVLDPEVQQRLLSAAVRAPVPAAEPSDNDLTPRESEVLRLIAAGKSNREIARALFVSEATVKTHVNRIFAKTGSRDRGQAMRYAYQHGYVEPPASQGLFLYRTGSLLRPPHHHQPRADGNAEEADRHADVVFVREPGRGSEVPRAGQPQDRHALAFGVAERPGHDQVAGLTHPVQEGDVLAEPRVLEQGPGPRRGRPRPVQQRHPGVLVAIAAPGHVLGVAVEHQRPAVVVFGPGRGRVRERLPAAVLQPDQRLPGFRGHEGDLDVAGPLGGLARMPAERHRIGRLPPGHGAPHGGLPAGRALHDLPAGERLSEGHGGVLAVHAELVQRPPPADTPGEHLERGVRVRVDQDLPADRRDGVHGFLLFTSAA